MKERKGSFPKATAAAFLIAGITTISAPRPAEAEDPAEEWFACDKDEDCEVATTYCSEPTAINGKYREAAGLYLHDPVSCRKKVILHHLEKVVIVEPHPVRCIENKCWHNKDSKRPYSK